MEKLKKKMPLLKALTPNASLQLFDLVFGSEKVLSLSGENPLVGRRYWDLSKMPEETATKEIQEIWDQALVDNSLIEQAFVQVRDYLLSRGYEWQEVEDYPGFNLGIDVSEKYGNELSLTWDPVNREVYIDLVSRQKYFKISNSLGADIIRYLNKFLERGEKVVLTGLSEKDIVKQLRNDLDVGQDTYDELFGRDEWDTSWSEYADDCINYFDIKSKIKKQKDGTYKLILKKDPRELLVDYAAILNNVAHEDFDESLKEGNLHMEKWLRETKFKPNSIFLPSYGWELYMKDSDDEPRPGDLGSLSEPYSDRRTWDEKMQVLEKYREQPCKAVLRHRDPLWPFERFDVEFADGLELTDVYGYFVEYQVDPSELPKEYQSKKVQKASELKMASQPSKVEKIPQGITELNEFTDYLVDYWQRVAAEYAGGEDEGAALLADTSDVSAQEAEERLFKLYQTGNLGERDIWDEMESVLANAEEYFGDEDEDGFNESFDWTQFGIHTPEITPLLEERTQAFLETTSFTELVSVFEDLEDSVNAVAKIPTEDSKRIKELLREIKNQATAVAECASWILKSKK